MKTIQSKIPFRNFPLALLVCFLTAQHVWAEVDLMGGNKSDSTIKMLVFPKSLRVVENFGEGETNKNFSDPKRIKKTLLKLDPARIVPAKMGEPTTGPITRDSLKHLAKQYSEDVILIFRRSVDNQKNAIRHQGLIYLAKQKKVLALKESKESGSESIQEMDLAGLATLAKQAKKVLHSHKFEKRQSAY